MGFLRLQQGMAGQGALISVLDACSLGKEHRNEIKERMEILCAGK